MASNHLSLFFQQKSNQLTRSTTIKSIPTDTHVVRNDSKSVKRSSTLSKVKRFGSMLVRNKQRPRIDTTSTSTVKSSNSCSSLISSTATDDSEEEEHIVTPNASTTQFKDMLITVATPAVAVNQMDLAMMSVTPKDQSNHVSPMVETIEPLAEQQAILNQELRNSVAYKPDLTKLENVLPKKSSVFMVRDQLRLAFEQADLELEHEFESSRTQMLESIKSVPRTLY